MWFLAESDESDRSFLDLCPEIAIVTNVENDHVSSDGDFEHLVSAFARFLQAVPSNGLALVGCDDARSAALAAQPRPARTRTYGFAAADYRAADVQFADFGSRFNFVAGERELGALRLAVPGALQRSERTRRRRGRDSNWASRSRRSPLRSAAFTACGAASTSSSARRV